MDDYFFRDSSHSATWRGTFQRVQQWRVISGHIWQQWRPFWAARYRQSGKAWAAFNEYVTPPNEGAWSAVTHQMNSQFIKLINTRWWCWHIQLLISSPLNKVCISLDAIIIRLIRQHELLPSNRCQHSATTNEILMAVAVHLRPTSAKVTDNGV